MTELSRGELIAWVNDLTQLNVPKVESLGTGAAHCLIIHSIYGDLPVHKINFKAIHEYEYVHNFKVLQEAFTRHRIDRTIPVDKLIKLKFQDNLEFLQWIKKYWDSNCDGSATFNASASVVQTASVVERRISAPSSVRPITKLNRSNSVNQSQSQSQRSNMSMPPAPPAPLQSSNNHNNTNTLNINNINNNSNPQSALQLAALTKTITELKLSVDEMEKERDFYFNKLRDIEILTQKITEPAILSSLFFKQITEILYTIEEGFEIPQQEGKEEKKVTNDDSLMA